MSLLISMRRINSFIFSSDDAAGGHRIRLYAVLVAAWWTWLPWQLTIRGEEGLLR